ncbi:MAG: nucleotidyl transferase AbiEii/AbiGii toxin family protein, partial [Desulfobacterales bacterium]|nr:nucleotidyl transferase AbiEii/AbiGii toxin family protein [Desulfobacterales bacterium]
MKDFYDILLLSKMFEFESNVLCSAIKNTFKRRNTQLPKDIPFAFTDEFRKDTVKQTQWKAFIRKSKPDMISDKLNDVIEEIALFILPIIKALNNGSTTEMQWKKNGSWVEANKAK